MQVNGAFFQLQTLAIESSSTVARTYTSTDGGGISLTGGIYIDTSANQTFNAPIGVDAATVQFRGNSGSSVISFTSDFYLNSNTAEIGGDSASTVIELSGIVSGSGGNINKVNGNTLRLLNENTYTGATTISAGILELGNGGTSGWVGSTSGITNNGTLLYNRSNDANAAFVISGSGVITKNGTGILGLEGNNSYIGTTTINAGAIEAKHANALGTVAGGVTVASNAALRLSGGIAVGAEALNLSGTGQSSTGALRNISGDNSYAGAITLNAASRINSDAGSLALTGGITGAHNLEFGGEGNTSVNSVIGTSTGSLTKDGAGTLTLQGANTYTGSTTVSAGTLRVNGSLAAGSSVSVGSTATLGGNGSIGGLVTLNSGGTLAPGNSVGGIATMTLSNGLSLNSTSTVRMDISNTSGSSDVIALTGTLSNAGNLELNILTAMPGGDFSNSYTIFSGGTKTGNWNSVYLAGAYTGDFTNNSGIWTRSAGDGILWTYDQAAGTLTVIPEPSTYALMGIGAAFLLWRLRRRRQA